MAIGALVTLKPKPGAAAELRERALDVAHDVRAEPGNVVTIVLSDPANPDYTLMLELFADEAAIDAHRHTPSTVEKGPAVHALLYEPMTVQWLHALDWPAAVKAIAPPV